MNLTDEQKLLLRKTVEAYKSGCHSQFIFVETHTDGCSLIYACHASVPVEASIADFTRLQTEGLIDCRIDGQQVSGKPTPNGLAAVERMFTLKGGVPRRRKALVFNGVCVARAVFSA